MNFLNVRSMPGGDFGFRIPDDLAEPIYFAFSHPDFVRYFEAGPVTASRLREGTWNVVLPRPATVEVRFKPASGPDGKPLFSAADYTLTPIIAGFHGGVPLLASGTLEEPAWSHSIRGLAPGAYNLHIQTTPRIAGASRDPQRRRPVFTGMRNLDLKVGEPVSVVFDPPAFRSDAWRGNRTATVVIRPFDESKLQGEDYRVRYTMPNYGLLPVSSGKLGADGRIALDGIALSGKEPYDGRYTVEVGSHQLGHFRVEDRPGRQEFTLQMPPQVGDRAPDVTAIDFDLASRNAKDLEDDLYNRLAKEHEFNEPRWPFVIKVRDVQDRALIDATLKHRVKGKDEFDLVVQTRKAMLHVDPGAKVLRVQLEDAEIQHYRHGSDLVLINNRTLLIPLPLEISTADFRGRIVFLEFWATWCGPCQEPMQRLVDLARRRGGDWSKDVALVTVGIDQDREPLLREVQQQGPTAIRHLWSPADEEPEGVNVAPLEVGLVRIEVRSQGAIAVTEAANPDADQPGGHPGQHLDQPGASDFHFWRPCHCSELLRPLAAEDLNGWSRHQHMIVGRGPVQVQVAARQMGQQLAARCGRSVHRPRRPRRLPSHRRG